MDFSSSLLLFSRFTYIKSQTQLPFHKHDLGKTLERQTLLAVILTLKLYVSRDHIPLPQNTLRDWKASDLDGKHDGHCRGQDCLSEMVLTLCLTVAASAASFLKQQVAHEPQQLLNVWMSQIIQILLNFIKII